VREVIEENKNDIPDESEDPNEDDENENEVPVYETSKEIEV